MASPEPNETPQGKSWLDAVFHHAYRVVKEGLWLLLIFSASLWLIVHSPIPGRADTGDISALVVQTLLIAGAASAVIILLVAIARGERWRRKTPDQINNLLLSILTVSSALSSVLLLFAGSVWIFLSLDLEKSTRDAASAALSNASTFALFVVASLISIMALFGWQNLSSHIDSRVQMISEGTKNELIGRFFSMSGLTMGELNADESGFEAREKRINESAVEFCRVGFDKLKGLSDGPRLMALNNYVYYTCLRQDPSNAPWLVQQSLILLESGVKYRSARLVLTYCQVTARYNHDLNHRTLALNHLRDVQKYFQLGPQEKKEALFCEGLFKDPSLPYELEKR